jgi:hypothetical protein
MSKQIAKVWTFTSDSNPDKSYETLLYEDDSISCACPGWTRRVASDGSRSCKHTRMVDQGIADSRCSSNHNYAVSVPVQKPVSKRTSSKKPTMTPTLPRKIHIT